MCEVTDNTDVKPIVADSAVNAEATAEVGVTMHKCLNCGTLSNGNFCPNCGQSMSVGRVKHKSLFRQFLCSFLRLDPVFLRTLRLLMVKPWKVIKDYLEGHQICYSQPVTTLVFIFFFKTILSLILGVSGDSFKDIWSGQYPGLSDGQMLVIKMVESILFIDIIKLMLTRLPLILAIKLVYNRTSVRKYSWAEYMTASVYILSSVTACSIVTDLFLSPFCGEETADYIAMLYSLVILFFTVHKIFPCKNLFIAVVKYGFSILLGAIFYIAYVMSICFAILCILYIIEPNTMEALLETGFF